MAQGNSDEIPPMSLGDLPEDPAFDLQDFFYERLLRSRDGWRTRSVSAEFTHRFLERPWKSSANFPLVLEVGAGNVEHLPFVAITEPLRDGSSPLRIGTQARARDDQRGAVIAPPV